MMLHGKNSPGTNALAPSQGPTQSERVADPQQRIIIMKDSSYICPSVQETNRER